MYGLRIIESELMADYVEDWSRVRSPSRAIRRRKRGFRQNIVTRAVPKKGALRMGDKIVMHPEIARELRRQIAERRSTNIERQTFDVLMGRTSP